MESHPSYSAPVWLPGGNLQTIYSAKLALRSRLIYRRERWETPDGDFIDLDWMDGDTAGPLYVLFHGLEGSSNSHYALSFMKAVRHRGAVGAVVHFRGCSGEVNRLPRAYHSGDSAEMEWVLRRLKKMHAKSRIFVAGISIGGNILLKWLGEQGEAAREIVSAGGSVCAPIDLAACGFNLQRGFNMVYTRMFLTTLKKKSLAKLTDYPELFDGNVMRQSRNLYEFDGAVTAPLHGYRDADDYWTRASSKPLLRHIAVPTLVLNALNDPFVPAISLPRNQEVSAHVQLEYPATGGHVGFVSGPFPGHLCWLPDRLMHHFDTVDL
ncbi:MAG TPA: alpha/beta fold hydrolase [Burkholderiales bacterium]|nr:alpha/beta fold hydrolase [Burkholderiales bacterium]